MIGKRPAVPPPNLQLLIDRDLRPATSPGRVAVGSHHRARASHPWPNPPMPGVKRVGLWLALLSTIYSQADAFTMLSASRVPFKMLSASRVPARPPHAVVQRTSTVHLMEEKKPVQKSNRFDLLIIGGGPVGVTAALRAAALGRTAILIDNTPPKQFQFTGPTGLFSKALRDSALRIDVPVLRSMGIVDTAIWAVSYTHLTLPTRDEV